MWTESRIAWTRGLVGGTLVREAPGFHQPLAGDVQDPQLVALTLGHVVLAPSGSSETRNPLGAKVQPEEAGGCG